tara:strand:+ start:65 stop:457 length:393 start_codon:yes stop_codon:yes gene_type:complete
MYKNEHLAAYIDDILTCASAVQVIDWQMLRIGTYIGLTVSLLLFLVLAIEQNTHGGAHSSAWSLASWIAIQPVYRLVFIPILAIYMWAINVLVFRKYRINWVYICEFHPILSASPGAHHPSTLSRTAYFC